MPTKRNVIAVMCQPIKYEDKRAFLRRQERQERQREQRK
jgi:hypothetical protein